MKTLLTPAEMEARLRGIIEKRDFQKQSESKTHHDHDFISNQRSSNPTITGGSSTNKKQNHDHDPREKQNFQPQNARLSNGSWIYNQVNTHPILQMGVKAWGMSHALMYRLVEEKGLDVVVRSLEFARTYTPARNKGAYATSLIRNGGPKRTFEREAV